MNLDLRAVVIRGRAGKGEFGLETLASYVVELEKVNLKLRVVVRYGLELENTIFGLGTVIRYRVELEKVNLGLEGTCVLLLRTGKCETQT